MLCRLWLLLLLLGRAGTCRPSAFSLFMMGPEILKALRASRRVPVWPRPNERWPSEKRGRKGSAELLLARCRIRFREKLEVVDGVEPAGEGSGAPEGDGMEEGEWAGGETCE